MDDEGGVSGQRRCIAVCNKPPGRLSSQKDSILNVDHVDAVKSTCHQELHTMSIYFAVLVVVNA